MGPDITCQDHPRAFEDLTGVTLAIPRGKYGF